MENNSSCLVIILELIFSIWLIWTINNIDNTKSEQQKELNSLKYRLDLIEGIKQKEHIYSKDTTFYEINQDAVYIKLDTIKYEY